MKVLLIDGNWRPVKIISWQKAIQLIYLNKAQVITPYPDKFVRSVSQSIQIPAVLRIFERSRKPEKVSCTPANIFFRDKYTCAYCGKVTPKGDLTLDHIYPLSLGGKGTWKNLISACRKCNNKKGARTPLQANMKLLFRPYEPKWNFMFDIKLNSKDPVAYWEDFLKGIGEMAPMDESLSTEE